MQFTRVSWSRTDGMVALVLAAVTIAYIAVWPRDLYKVDEGLFLYGAKRILDGDVIYRDFFEIITPGSFYAMAFLFRVFGVDMATARLGMAALHASIVVLIYLTSRLVGVRVMFAAFAAVMHVAISYPAVTIASPHWFGTLAILLIQLAFLRSAGTTRARSALLPGICTGLLCSVQQQKGAVFVMAGAVLILATWLINRRYRSPAAPLLPSLIWFGSGVAAVVMVWLLPLLVLAGPRVLLDDLVFFALFNYGVYNQRGWGTYVTWMPNDAFPGLIYSYPVLLMIAAGRGVIDYIGARQEARLRSGVVLLVMSGAAVLSVMYVPDYFHLVVMAPVFFILGANIVEWLLGLLERLTRLATPVAEAVAVVLALALVLQAQWNLRFRWQRYPFSHQTAFGRVNFRNPQEIVVIDKIRELTRGDPNAEMFCYQSCSGIYLTTGTRNPTAYQQLIPVYNGPQAYEAVFKALDARRVPYVVLTFSAWTKWKDDPMRPYVGKHYVGMRNVPWKPSRFREFMILSRKPDTAQDTPPS